jgi:hypothetical protein
MDVEGWLESTRSYARDVYGYDRALSAPRIICLPSSRAASGVNETETVTPPSSTKIKATRRSLFPTDTIETFGVDIGRRVPSGSEVFAWRRQLGTLRCVKTLLIALAALVLVSATSASASAPAGFNEAVKLEPAASFVAAKPVTVYCANSEYTWEQYGGTSTEHGLATPGSSEIKIDPDGCRYLRTALNMHKIPDGFGAALLVLVHESIHARGETDEGITDCDAVREMPRVAVKFFGVKAGKQLRAVMANAWRYRGGESAAYRTVC